jgi:hypothetical protein
MEEATFRTIPEPRPCHVIEPNLPFFLGLEATTYSLLSILNDNRLLPDDYRNKLGLFLAMVSRTISIVGQEVRDKPVSAEDNEWITTIPNQFGDLVLPPGANAGGYMMNAGQLQMAMIADVHTDALAGQVLEVGTGIPLRIHVALNDGQGGKRIATGYTYNYYEFTHPMNDRLTDEQWKAQVYAADANLAGKRPFWLRGVVP